MFWHLWISSPLLVVSSRLIHVSSWMNNLMALSQASDLVQQVQELQEQMSEIQQMLQVNTSSERFILCQNPPRSVPDPLTRIPGATWSEEMDVRDCLSQRWRWEHRRGLNYRPGGCHCSAIRCWSEPAYGGAFGARLCFHEECGQTAAMWYLRYQRWQLQRPRRWTLWWQCSARRVQSWL